jgi:hypothetical protein
LEPRPNLFAPRNWKYIESASGSSRPAQIGAIAEASLPERELQRSPLDGAASVSERGAWRDFRKRAALSIWNGCGRSIG